MCRTLFVFEGRGVGSSKMCDSGVERMGAAVCAEERDMAWSCCVRGERCCISEVYNCMSMAGCSFFFFGRAGGVGGRIKNVGPLVGWKVFDLLHSSFS